MAFEVKMIKHSISKAGAPIATMQLKYPRFIHAEFMTHRVFSRNASSSRAIPVAKMIEMVRTEPAMPIHWGVNQPGMQADNQLDADDIQIMKNHWHLAAANAADQAEFMASHGLHKQVANRILEPFQWISVVVTATEWNNFFALRCHPDAQPEIHHLALMMRDCLEMSVPEVLELGEYHLPYIVQGDKDEAIKYCQTVRITRDMPNEWEVLTVLRKMSAARCARVSYLTHDGRISSVAEDLELYERLAGSAPIHASPLEHQAQPDAKNEDGNWYNPELHGNLVGWLQHRMLAGENLQ